MKTRLILVTGGARSGKSGHAMSLAEAAGGWPVYIATATAGDTEMAERIAKHKDERGTSWATIEEPLDIKRVLAGMTRGENAVVLDCLTLWLTNIMMNDEEDFELAAGIMARELVSRLRVLGGTVVVVSNEIGMGLVPEGSIARRFRDMAGAVNRQFAEASDEVYFMVSGIPLKIKPGNSAHGK